MSDQEILSPIVIDQSCAIDLLDPTTYRWKVKRHFTLLTVAKILAAILVFPAMFFSVFLVLWALAAVFGSVPIVVLTCLILLAFIVALSKLVHDRWLGDESVSYQRAVLSSLSGILLFVAISLFAFLVADLKLIDGQIHSLYEWSFYFSNVLSYNALAQIAGDQSGVSVNHWYSKAVVVTLNAFFYSTVITTIINFVFRSVKHEDNFTGTQLELWAHLLSPALWFEDCEIEETGRLIDSSDRKLRTFAGRTNRRKAIISVGGYGYAIIQLMRYVKLPWKMGGTYILHRKSPEIRVRKRDDNVWWIEESNVPDLAGNPFLKTMTDMIDFAIRHFTEAEKGGLVAFRFSEGDFFGSTIVLEKTGLEGDFILYRWKVWGVKETEKEGSLYSDLLSKVFPNREPPAQIYVQAKPVRTANT